MSSLIPKYSFCFILIIALTSFIGSGQSVDDIIKKAVRLQEAGEYDQAIDIFEESFGLLESRDSAFRWFGLIHCNIAYVHAIKQDDEKAIQSFKKGIEFYHQDTLIHLETFLYAHFDLGLQYINQYFKNKQDKNLLDSADQYLSIALEIKDEILPVEHLNHYRMWLKTGEVLFDREEFENAKVSFQQAHQHIKRHHPNKIELIRQISNLIGQSFQQLNQADSALYYYQIALENSERTIPQEEKHLVVDYYNVAAMWHRLHAYDKAMTFLDKAIAVRPESLTPYIRKEFLIKAAGYYFESNQLESAELYYLQSLEEKGNNGIEAKEMEGLALIYLFVVYTKLGKNNEAFKIMDRACSFFTQHFPHEPMLAEETCKTSQAFKKIMANPEKVEALLRSKFQDTNSIQPDVLGRVLKENLGIDPSIFEYEMNEEDPRYNLHKANELSLLSTHLYLQQDFPGALQAIQEGYKLLVPSFDPGNNLYIDPKPTDFTFNFSNLSSFYLIKCGTILSKISTQASITEKEWNYAFSLFDKTDQALQRIRRTGLKTSQLSVAENLFVAFYYNMAHLYTLKFQETNDQKYIEEVYYALEKRKAINLLEKQSLKSLRLTNPVFIALQQKEQQLLDNINKVSTQLSIEYGLDGEPSFDQGKIDRLRNKYFLVDQKYSAFYAKIKDEHPTYYQLKEPPSTMAPTEISRLLDEKTAVINYYLSDDLLTTIVLLEDNQMQIYFGQKVPELKKWISSIRSVFDSRGMVNGAYREAAINLYETLIPRLPESIENIIIAPDGQLFNVPFDALLLHTTPKGTPVAYLPFLVKYYNFSYGASATFISNNIRFGSDYTRTYQNLLLGFAPEADTYLRIKLLENILGADFETKKIKILTQDHATKHHFFVTTQDPYQIIQVDAHGNVGQDFESYHFSLNDAKLYLPEIMNHTVHCDLFILASCDSGSGKIMPAEGLLGFVRALQFAGANNVITSKNRIALGTAKFFSEEFYRQVFLKKQSYSAALRAAKLKMISSETRYSDPFYWSGLTLFGR